MNCNDLARAVTKAGMILLESGAETYRVEDTMKRICLSFGAEVVDSYATPTLIIISFSLDNELCHNIKRTQLKAVDLNKIDRVNGLSRELMEHEMSLTEFHQKLMKIDQEERYHSLIMILGAAICSFGFVLFFGGNIFDAFVAFFLGAFTKVMTIELDNIDFNSFFKYIISGAFVCFCSIFLNNIHLCQSLNTLIISVDMLLVPGLAITNAIRDTVNGDLVSGLARAEEAVFIAIAIALGSGLIFALIGGY